MRLTTILLIAFSLHLSARVASQITLRTVNMPLEKVFEKVQQQTSYAFFYTGTTLGHTRPVTMDVKNVDIKTFLQLCLANQALDFSINGETIFITRKPESIGVNAEPVNSSSPPSPPPINIRGRIVNENGEPVIASVVIKGTTRGTTSDINGEFVLNNVNDNAVLVISATNIESREILLAKQNLKMAADGSPAFLSIIIKTSISSLNDVVVVGYGTQRKGEVTSAIVSLKPGDFNKGNIMNPIGLMQGKIAGLSIVNEGGGDPNGNMEVQLRGLTSLSGGTSPLFIIDGVLGGDINSVNVEEIESIDVLKDGSAAAIYGTRGNNGVIIITTKKAKAGTRSLEFSTWASTQTVNNKLRTFTADEFRQVLADRYPGREDEFDHGASTDWFDEITHTPLDQYYNIAMSGGADKFSYRAAINYRTSQGLVKNSGNNRVQAKLSVLQKEFNEKLTIDYSLIYAHTSRQYADRWALQQAFRYNPTEPVYDTNNIFTGGYYRNAGPFEYFNPVAMINEQTNEGVEDVVTGSATIRYNLFRGMYISALGSVIRGSYENSMYQSRYYPMGLGSNGVARKTAGKNTSKLLEISGDFKRSFGAHNFQAIAGYSYQDGMNSNFSASNSNFDTDIFSYNNLGAGYGLSTGNASMGSFKESNKLIAFFGRVTYNYAEKYLLTVSGRYEGSSRFGVNHKWGTFPAISVGWRLNREDFFMNSSWLTDLKLRAGYGVTGNQDIGNYRALQLLTTGRRFLYNGQWVTTYPPASNPNPNLKWERKGELNIGLDFEVLKGRVYGNVDYYVRNTSDLLWTYSVPVPPNVYNQLYTNVGEMRNKGIEVTLTGTPVSTKNFSWTTSVLYSSNRNKLVSFSDTSRGYQLTDLKTGWLEADLQTWSHQIVEGGSIGNFVAPVFLGIDADGNSILKDNNKDGFITDEDREIVGNAYPKFQVSFNNTFVYKNWDLNIFFRGVFGNDVLNMHRMYYENFSYFGNKNILYSALEFPEFKGKAEYSSRFIEDASFIKLDNVSLGYNIKSTGKIFKHARVYVTGQQLLTITDYKGIDPEITLIGLDPGVDDYSYYPRTRKFTIGVNFTF